MNDQTPAHQPGNSPTGGHIRPSLGKDLTLPLAVLGLGLGLAALVVLARAGGSIEVTSTGVTMAVNARP